MEQGQPPQGAPQGGQDGFGKLVSGVFEGLGMMSDVLGKANVPPEILQRVAKLQDEFQDIVGALQGSPEDEGQEMSPKPPSQPQDAMAGASGVPVS